MVAIEGQADIRRAGWAETTRMIRSEFSGGIFP